MTDTLEEAFRKNSLFKSTQFRFEITICQMIVRNTRPLTDLRIDDVCKKLVSESEGKRSAPSKVRSPNIHSKAAGDKVKNIPHTPCGGIAGIGAAVENESKYST